MIRLDERSRIAGVAEADQAAAELAACWQQGDEPNLSQLWAEQGASLSTLAAMVKADLRCRFARGQEIAVADYLERFPELQNEAERVVSLVYEEYCLLEEQGKAPDPDRFCERYEPWKDSLASQLRYHRLLSQVAGTTPTPTKYPEPGEFFLQFRLRSILGQGGAARVYLADDEDLGGRHRALKVSPDRGDEPSIMGRLDHRHIVPVLSLTRDPESGLRGLCMPYRPGRPLDAVLRRMESTPPSSRSASTLWEAAKPEPTVLNNADADADAGWADFPRRSSYADAVAWVVASLAEALAHAHSRGILHRDVKPANVLLTAADGPQLLDFNLAHDPHAADHAEAALKGGTLPYMAPEQLRAFLDADHWDDVGPAADLYALGLLLREFLTGRRPEAPDPDLPLPRAIQELLDWRSETPGSVREQNPTVPHALDAIVLRCLAPGPENRYPNASALAEDLHRYLRRRPLRYANNRSKREAGRNWVWCHRWLLIALLLVPPLLAGPPLLARGPIATAYARHGFDCRDRGELVAAVEAFRFAHTLNPGLTSARNGLELLAEDFRTQASADLQTYNIEGFRQSMNRARQLGYRRSQVDAKDYFELARYHLYQMEDFQAARETFLLASELDPKFYPAYHGLGVIAQRENQPERFWEYMDRAIECSSNSDRWKLEETTILANLYQQRAAAAVILEEYQQALDDLKVAMRQLEDSGEQGDEAQETRYRIHYTAGKAHVGRMNQLGGEDEREGMLQHQQSAEFHLQKAQEIRPNRKATELLRKLQEIGSHEQELTLDYT